MTDSDDLRALITHIRMVDGEMRKLEAYRAALGTLCADCPYPEQDFGVAGCAWTRARWPTRTATIRREISAAALGAALPQ